MRENMGLFRGKRLDNGQWVEGFLFHDIDCGETEIQFVQYAVDDYAVESWHNGYEVDPSTVGECTGIPDIKGRIMWEGDIVEYVDDYMMHCSRGVVCFHDGSFCLAVEHKYGNTVDHYYHRIGHVGHVHEQGFSGDIHYKYRIVGNIHDNPDLMEA